MASPPQGPAALLDGALGVAARVARAAALGGGLLMLAAALLVAVDVSLRKALGITLGGADELSGYALAIGSTWSFAFVLLNRGNVRIDALYQKLPRGLAALCDLLALLALLVFGSVVAWHGLGVVTQSAALSARSNSALGVPLVLPQAMWWAGYAVFLACGVLLMLRSLVPVLHRDWVGVNRLIGARSIEEEAAEELANALHAREAAAGAAAGPGAPR